MLTLMLMLFAKPAELQRLQLVPVPFQTEAIADTLIDGVSCLETDGTHVYLGQRTSPYVLELDGRGRYIRSIGGKGQGPGMLGNYGIRALSISPGGLWVVSSSNGLGLNYYEQGQFLFKFPLQSYPLVQSKTNLFGVSGEQVVVAAHPRGKHLALAYNYDGKVEQAVGDILPINREDLEYNAALNDTHWLYYGEKWYCLFKYRPFLRVYNKDFSLEHHFSLEGPEISIKEDEFYSRAPKKHTIGKLTFPFPYFRDFKAFGKHLYFTCNGVLYQVNGSTGHVVSRHVFFPKIKGYEHSNSNHHMAFFCFLNSGQLMLVSSSEIVGHYLWTVDKTFKP